MTDLPPAFGFLGPADITPANLDANLSDSLPDDAVFYVPDFVKPRGTGNPGVRKVIKWLGETYDENDTVRVPDVLAALRRDAKEGRVVSLIFLYEPGNADGLGEIRDALEAGVPVLDLVNGMFPLDIMEPTAEPASGPPGEPPPGGPERPAEAPAWGAPRPYIEEVPGAAQDDTGMDAALYLDTLLNDVMVALGKYVRGFVQHELDLLTRPLSSVPDPPLLGGPVKKYTVDGTGMHYRRKRGSIPQGHDLTELTDSQAEYLRGIGKMAD